MESTSTWDTGISGQHSAIGTQDSAISLYVRQPARSEKCGKYPSAASADLAVKDLVSAVQQFANVALAIITGCGRVGGLALGRDQEEGLWLPI
jgi:hypothetical protein